MKRSIKLLALAGCISLASTALVSTSFAENRSAGNGSGPVLVSPQLGGKDARRASITNPLQFAAPKPLPAPVPKAAPASTLATAKAWSLYRAYCFNCHGSAKQGVSASVIKSAISSISAMKSLSSLNFVLLNGIAAGQ